MFLNEEHVPLARKVGATGMLRAVPQRSRRGKSEGEGTELVLGKQVASPTPGLSKGWQLKGPEVRPALAPLLAAAPPGCLGLGSPPSCHIGPQMALAQRQGGGLNPAAKAMVGGQL